jgi:hypothetical protein
MSGMMERRSFLLSACAAALLPAADPLPARAVPRSFPVELQQALGNALDDPTLGEKLAPVLLDVGFNWQPPSQPAASFQTIIAYSFGNRPKASGASNPSPGPINETLANAVAEAQHRSKASTVYAQWEIAGFLTSKSLAANIVPINPVVAADGSVTYLSTDGVAQAAVTHAGGDATKLGRVCVIGHHDHAKRCVQTSRARGMDAWAMEGLQLPAGYDPDSDQPWTRNREIYLIHDMAAQLMQIRAARLANVPAPS